MPKFYILEPWLVFFLKTMAEQKDKLSAKVKEEQSLRASLPALSRQILELVKTRGEITVKEIEESTGANRNTIKVHVKKLAEQQYLRQVGQGRGGRYMIKGPPAGSNLRLWPRRVPANVRLLFLPSKDKLDSSEMAG